MITIRKASERGHAQHGWLESYHTFSFADYHDAKHMGFRPLRVINEDWIQPGEGFGSHSHRDMEIITYVLDGALAHRDSMGTSSVIRPGEVQRMSAGTGVTHSEHNHSQEDVVHLLQIWLLPARGGIAPSYEQRLFSEEERGDRLCLVGSSDGRNGSITIHQDVALYAALLSPGCEVQHTLAAQRYAWIQIARGSVEVDGHALGAGDGAAIDNAAAVHLRATAATELLLFDLS